MSGIIKALFGCTAEDIKHYADEGYAHALCLDHPDALETALHTAALYSLTNQADMVYSIPYPRHHCPGYMVLKDQEAAEIVQMAVLRSGFECTRVKDLKIAPSPYY